jgi:hypothetical protein
MTTNKVIEFRAIARRARTFESAVDDLLMAGIKSRGVAIRMVQRENGPLYNTWMAKKHPGVKQQTLAAPSARTGSGVQVFSFKGL